MSYHIALPDRGTFEAWRGAARLAISHRIPPDQIAWSGGIDMFGSAVLPEGAGPHSPRASRAFVMLANAVIWHASPERFDLLYRALWRIDAHDGNPMLQTDALGQKLFRMAKSVRRDIHKMHAFVRFRELPPANGERRSFGAWFEPEHHTLEPGAPFFAGRFGDMDWIIATPRMTARFQAGQLTYEDTGGRPELPPDASGELWEAYFSSIFNPARIKLNAMRAEMPRKYWRNLPETRLIPAMLANAEARVRAMQDAGATAPRSGSAAVSARYRASISRADGVPETLDEARSLALQCRRCSLCEAATQTVWGEGAQNAALMIVGEQPGDQEDLVGRPFVGPAGQLLRSLLGKAGVIPESVWLTNAVKHFKFRPQGKRRLHQNPGLGDIKHCRWWLNLELAMVRPRVVLALGASATVALTGDGSPVSSRRGRFETGLHGGRVLVSWHPAHILRAPDINEQARLRRELTLDIAAATQVAQTPGEGP